MLYEIKNIITKLKVKIDKYREKRKVYRNSIEYLKDCQRIIFAGIIIILGTAPFYFPDGDILKYLFELLLFTIIFVIIQVQIRKKEKEKLTEEMYDAEDA